MSIRNLSFRFARQSQLLRNVNTEDWRNIIWVFFRKITVFNDNYCLMSLPQPWIEKQSASF